MNEVLKGSGVAIYTGGEKEIIVRKIHESIDYIESHGQDTPYFMALADIDILSYFGQQNLLLSLLMKNMIYPINRFK